ncbi:hypothetical protein [Ohtaekwangia koreensis]|uniref:SpoIIAA-like n=1 Tax=Ohtaekwangia koreensis TaxID=688867 RepID=A0A1T5M137_9BACT|nr:hypothetical protein [Ohtaekwangia koreensis]SKC81936.1 hypothetical protein SAMN05660236_4058 [Ohtaekwangia koreensis]
MIKYYDNDCKTIWYDEVHHILIASWKLTPTSDEFRACMMVAINAMKKFNTGRIVYDLTSQGMLMTEDKQWLADEWRTMAIAAGHSHVSFVTADDLLVKISAESMMEMAKQDIPYAYFSNMEDAVSWITLPAHAALGNSQYPSV